MTKQAARLSARSGSTGYLAKVYRLTKATARRPRTPMGRRHMGMTTLRRWRCRPTDCPSRQGRMLARGIGSMEVPRRLPTRFTRQPPSSDFRAGNLSSPSHCSLSPISSQRTTRSRSHTTRMPPVRPPSRQCPPPLSGLLPTHRGAVNLPRPRQGPHQGTA